MNAYAVIFKDADGFDHVCEDLIHKNFLCFNSDQLAKQALETHKADIEEILSPKVVYVKKWFKTECIRTPNNLPDFERVRYQRIIDTIAIKKVKIV